MLISKGASFCFSLWSINALVWEIWQQQRCTKKADRNFKATKSLVFDSFLPTKGNLLRASENKMAINLAHLTQKVFLALMVLCKEVLHSGSCVEWACSVLPLHQAPDLNRFKSKQLGEEGVGCCYWEEIKSRSWQLKSFLICVWMRSMWQPNFL